MALYGIGENKSLRGIYTKDEIDELVASAGSKNRLTWGGRCLFDARSGTAGVFDSVDAIQESVTAGDFSQIYIGDYIMAEITTSYKSNEVVKLVVADLDYYLHRGSTETTAHHLVMTTEDCFATTEKMNSSSTTSGGYVGTAMHKTVLPKYATALKTALNNHVLSTTRYFSSAVNTSATNPSGGQSTGASSSWSNTTVECFLPSEVQVYGTRAFSEAYDVGDSTQQLAYYMLRPDKLVAHLGYEGTSRYHWWLSSVASSTSFCRVNGVGCANYDGALLSFGVRPLFLFG